MPIRNVLRLCCGILAAAAAAGLPAVAQVPASPDPGKVRGGSYAVEPEHTQVEFGVLHLGFTSYFGRFSGASGRLVLSPADPASDRLEVSVPTGSVSTTSDALNGMLRGPRWLDAARFPRIGFVSTKVTPIGPADATVTGELTLHGVTEPVTLAVHFMAAGFDPVDGKYTVGFQASGAIRRSEFGVTEYLPLVGDEVRLTLSGAFERAD